MSSRAEELREARLARDLARGGPHTTVEWRVHPVKVTGRVVQHIPDTSYTHAPAHVGHCDAASVCAPGPYGPASLCAPAPCGPPTLCGPVDACGSISHYADSCCNHGHDAPNYVRHTGLRSCGPPRVVPMDGSRPVKSRARRAWH